MKKTFKVLMYLIVISVGGYYGVSGWQSWQEYRNEQAIIGSPQGQLPEWAEPIRYDLHLNVDPALDTFSGQVKIDIQLTKSTDIVWLHGEEFEVSSATWVDSSNITHSASYQELGHSGVVRVDLGKIIEPQTIQLHIEFDREFPNDLAGLYKVKRKDGADVFTQFEATDARKAFPSFDEPRFKVPFTVQLTIPSHLKGFSNTPEVSRDENNGKTTIGFKTSKPLPTYLVAFAIGDFDVVDGGNIEPNIHRDYAIPFRAIAVKGKGEKLGYAIAKTEEILFALEDYFGRPYPYEKLDIVAVPDFRAGAMENAGLITYREQLLLIGDEPSISEQQRYYRVHAHELAHQWFGNLVTMPWWNDLWLNESFANWMEGKITAKLRPDFRNAEDNLNSVHNVMDSDSLISSRQIREPIKTNGDIESAFDGITYTKGGGVLNMFESYLGKEAFQKGVQLHLERFAWKNATAPDFIESMATATNQPELVKAFNSFIEQPGVPFVEFSSSCEAIDTENEITSSATSVKEYNLTFNLKQSRYLPVGSKGNPNESWQIPMCVTLIGQEREQYCLVLSESEQTQSIPASNCPAMVFPNMSAKGYYRWSVDNQQLDALLHNLPKLDQLERISLKSNVMANIESGKIAPERLVESAAAFVNLTDYESKFLPLGSLEFLADKFASDDEKLQMNIYLKTLYGNYLEELGFDNSTELDKQEPALAAKLRYRLLNLFSAKLNDKTIRNDLTQKAIKYVGYQSDGKISEEAINSELASMALGIAVQDLGEDFYNHLEALLNQSDDGTLRQRLLSGMSSTKDPELSERVLGLVISTDTRLNEKFIMIGGQLQMKETQQFAYDWFKSKYSLISLVLPERYLSYAPMVGYDFCDREKQNDLAEFFKDKIPSGSSGERNLKLTLENIQNCVSLKEHITSIEIPSEIR